MKVAQITFSDLSEVVLKKLLSNDHVFKKQVYCHLYFIFNKTKKVAGELCEKNSQLPPFSPSLSMEKLTPLKFLSKLKSLKNPANFSKWLK